MPVAIPANVDSVLYVQMRMIACIAYMAGYDLNSDLVQTFVYACLAGVSLAEIVKQTAKIVGTKIAVSSIKKIPSKVLTKINQKVGFRHLTKFGSNGVINIAKFVPLVGGLVGGSFDLIDTKIIGNRAYKWFIESDFECSDDNDEILIEAEDID